MNVAAHPITVLSVCTGSGYLDLAVELACCQETVPVLFCEGEAYAAALLAKRMGEGTIPEAPIWSDLNTLTSKSVRAYMGEVLRGRPLGIFCGGIPCQPWSHAGKQLRKEDDRDLWPGSFRAIGHYKPELVFLENVPGFLAEGGLDRVATDLESLGYRVAAGLFSAKETGAALVRESLRRQMADEIGPLWHEALDGLRAGAGTDRLGVGLD